MTTSRSRALRRSVNEWTSTALRIVGTVGLLYELFVDMLRNPTALVVFGGLAGLPDVLSYRQVVKQQVQAEVERDDARREEERE